MKTLLPIFFLLLLVLPGSAVCQVFADSTRKAAIEFVSSPCDDL